MSCNNCCYKNYDDNEYFCEYHMKHIIDYDMDCPDTQDDFISITNVFDRLNEFRHLCKINGACGRLLCCLAYEDETYIEAAKKLPKVGDKIKTRSGDAQVLSVDIINHRGKILRRNH